MGLFKSMKDLSDLTKQAKQLQRRQQQEQGYEPGFKGQMQQMGDMLSQANEQLADLTGQSGDRSEILANAPAPSSDGGDNLAELERLAKLRDSGALTDAEFEQQKAKILGS